MAEWYRPKGNHARFEPRTRVLDPISNTTPIRSVTESLKFILTIKNFFYRRKILSLDLNPDPR